MRVEQMIVAALRADATVGPLVLNATSPATWRIFHNERPQDSVLPALSYQRVNQDRELALDGPAELAQVFVVVDVYAASSSAAKQLADAVRSALDGVTGNLGGGSVQHVWLTDETDISEVEGDLKVRRISLDFNALVRDE